jgi:hypothetical protein
MLFDGGFFQLQRGDHVVVGGEWGRVRVLKDANREQTESELALLQYVCSHFEMLHMRVHGRRTSTSCSG